MEHIEYKFVPPDSKEFEELQAFARSFDHEIIPCSSKNVFATLKNGVLIGYSEHVFSPVVYPAFHPDFTTPRDVVRVMADWKSHSQLSGKQTYIAAPTNNISDKGETLNFPAETMKRLGLVRMNRELYSPA